jgi:hypothetical protein
MPTYHSFNGMDLDFAQLTTFFVFNIWRQGVSSVSKFPIDINLRDLGERNRNSREFPNHFSVIGI